MNIRKKLYLNAVLPLILVASIGAVLYVTSRHVADVTAQERVAAELVKGVFELTIVADDYLLNHSERAERQWNMKYQSLGQLLGELRSREQAQAAILARMKSEHQGILATFNELAANHQKGIKSQERQASLAQRQAELAAAAAASTNNKKVPATPNPALQEVVTEQAQAKREAAALREFDARLVGQLLAKSQAMVSGGLQLARINQDKVAQTERNAALTIFGFVLFTGLGIAATSLLINRSVVRPIARVKAGTEAVARGDLTYRLGIRTKDEIGDLARTFDQMLDNLRATTASRDELNRANEELRNSTSALIQSEKMASIGQMVAGVAHEINTPLAYVRGNVEIVKDQMDQTRQMLEAYEGLAQALLSGNDEKVLGEKFNNVNAMAAEYRNGTTAEESKDLLARGLSGLDQIRELVMNLKNFSRLDRERVSGFNLNEGLDNVLLLAKPVLKSRIKVIKEFGDITFVACSPSQVNQVFLNVITNAAQAIDAEKGGTILVKTSMAGPKVQIQIRDNGKGIPPETLPKIFDPFFTTKKVGEGTGLGLSISRKIVEEHGGTIQMQSAVGKGSLVTITLPAEGAVELRKRA
jgi:signal transduction histidine kinase